MNPISNLKVSSGSRMVAGTSLVIEVKGCGNVMSFKNAKRAIQDENTGQMRTVTSKKVSQRKKAFQNAIVSELFCVLGTISGETPMGAPLPSLIALLPPDDNWQVIPDLQVTSEKVEKGQEGFLIIIEKL